MIKIRCQLTCDLCGESGEALVPAQFHYSDGCFTILAATVSSFGRWCISVDGVSCAAGFSCQAQRRPAVPTGDDEGKGE